jgi:hypothetical protein
MATQKKYKCHYCKDTGVIVKNNGNVIETCTHCLNTQKFFEALDLAIANSRCAKNHKQINDFKSVKSFLPEFPVMAYLEAEARGLNDNFLELLQSTFNILPFK